MQTVWHEFVQNPELTWDHGKHQWIEQQMAYRIGTYGKVVLFVVGEENQPTFGSAALPKALSRINRKTV